MPVSPLTSERSISKATGQDSEAELDALKRRTHSSEDAILALRKEMRRVNEWLGFEVVMGSPKAMADVEQVTIPVDIEEVVEGVASAGQNAASTVRECSDEREPFTPVPGRPTKKWNNQLSEPGDDHDKHRVYEVRDSLWDSCLIMFLPGVFGSTLDSILAVVLILTNIAIQVGFTLIVGFQAGDISHEIGSVEAQNFFFEWRLGVGHHIKYYDASTNTSLTTRVCKNYNAAVLSYEQKEVSTSIEEYTSGFGAWGYGPPLCLLAVGIWTLLIFRELRSIWQFATAIWSLRHGRKTVIQAVDKSDNNRLYRVQKMSRKRLWLSLLTSTLPRTGIALALWVYGALWLTYTREMSNLILNAVALGFVMEVDELLFTFLPRRFSRRLLSIEPLPRHYRRVRSVLRVQTHGDLESLCVLTAYWVFLAVWFTTIFQDFYGRLGRTQDILCGGTQNFVYNTDAVTGVVKVAETLPSDEFRHGGAGSTLFEGAPHVFDVILQATTLAESGTGSYRDLQAVGLGRSLARTATVGELSTAYVATPLEILESVPCQDLDDFGAPERVAMKQRLGFTECSMLADQCGDEVVRLFCARTCNCHTATSGLFDRRGCPPSCSSAVVAHQQALKTARVEGGRQCSDLEDHGNPGWQDTYLHELQESLIQAQVLQRRGSVAYVSEAFIEEFQERTNSIWILNATCPVDLSEWFSSSIAQERSCWIIPHLNRLFHLDLCSRTGLADNMGNLLAFCPQTCGDCDTGVAMPSTLWYSLAEELESINVHILQLRAEKAFADAQELHMCARRGSSPQMVLSDSTAGLEATDSIGQPSPDRTYTFRVPHTGPYLFSVSGEFSTYLSLWNGFTFEEAHATFDPQHPSSCMQVDLPAGGSFVLVVEGENEEEKGNFTLTVLCPWSTESRPGTALEQCQQNPGLAWRDKQEQMGKQGVTETEEENAPDSYSTAQATCESLGHHRVFGIDRCGEAARALGLKVTALVAEAPWAPVGCTFLQETGELLVDGTGQARTECGPTSSDGVNFTCLCSSNEDHSRAYNNQPSLCSQSAQGACKSCVELVDEWCKMNYWDPMCFDVCGSVCFDVCMEDAGKLLPFRVESGPCALDGMCVTSGNYPASYGILETCQISVVHPSLWTVSMEAFRTEATWDILQVDGIPYDGWLDDHLPLSLGQVSSIAWSSDWLETSPGWRLCAGPSGSAAAGPGSEGDCYDTDYGATDLFGRSCAELAVKSPFCTQDSDTENFTRSTMCCHCNGGSTMTHASKCSRQEVGSGWRLVRRTTSGTFLEGARLQSTAAFVESDQLRGTAEHGRAHNDPLGESLSVRFVDALFDQFMFTTGDCNEWMIMQKSEVLSWYSGARRVESTHADPLGVAGYTMSRRPDAGIELGFGDARCNNLYAEGVDLEHVPEGEDLSLCGRFHSGRGFNVFIRQACSRPMSGCDGPGDAYDTCDCDGDGLLDHRCRSADGGLSLVLSAEGCPDSWGHSNRSVSECQACTDVAGFVDEQDRPCSDWLLFQCDYAQEDWAYSAHGEAQLLANCRRSCGLCPAEEAGQLGGPGSLAAQFPPEHFQAVSEGICPGRVILQQPAEPERCRVLCTAYANCTAYSVGTEAGTARQCILHSEQEDVASPSSNPQEVGSFRCHAPAPPPTSATAGSTAPVLWPLEEGKVCDLAHGYRYLRVSNGGPVESEACASMWALNEIVLEGEDTLDVDFKVHSVSSSKSSAAGDRAVDGDPATYWAGDPSQDEGLGQECFGPSKAGQQWIILEQQQAAPRPLARIDVTQHQSMPFFSVSSLLVECSQDRQSWTAAAAIPVELTGTTTVFEACSKYLDFQGGEGTPPEALGLYERLDEAAEGAPARVGDHSWFPVYKNSFQKYLYFWASTGAWWVGDDARAAPPAAAGGPSSSMGFLLQGRAHRSFCPEGASDWQAASPNSLWQSANVTVLKIAGFADRV